MLLEWNSFVCEGLHWKIEELYSELWDVQWSYICVIGVPKGQQSIGPKKHLKKYLMAEENFKFDDNYKPMDPRISLDPKYEKHARNCTKAHNFFKFLSISSNQRLRKY